MNSLSIMDNGNEETKPTAASVATNTSSPDAFPVDTLSRKVQEHVSENIERLQLAPAVEPSMNNRSYTHKYTKQAANSPLAGKTTKGLQLAPAVWVPPHVWQRQGR